MIRFRPGGPGSPLAHDTKIPTAWSRGRAAQMKWNGSLVNWASNGARESGREGGSRYQDTVARSSSGDL